MKKEEGILYILSKLSDPDIFSLATTVTTGFLKEKLTTREEALAAIIKYSTDAEIFLRRKVIKREIIFEYLHANNIEVSFPTTKERLIEQTLKFWHSTETNTTNNVANIQSEVDSMSKSFTEWYYSLLNQPTSLGSEHFFPDSRCVVYLKTGAEVITESVESALNVANLLTTVKHNYNLIFNPSTQQGRMEPHGLVLITVCGTLHTNQVVCGVFEQMFTLARDPASQNNWKIKSSELVLRNGQQRFNNSLMEQTSGVMMLK